MCQKYYGNISINTGENFPKHNILSGLELFAVYVLQKKLQVKIFDKAYIA